MKEIYEVLKVEGKTGLTVGHRVMPAGARFAKKDWPYGEESLEKAIESKRCKLVEDKPEVKTAGNAQPVEHCSEPETEKSGKAKKKSESSEPETEKGN